MSVGGEVTTSALFGGDNVTNLVVGLVGAHILLIAIVFISMWRQQTPKRAWAKED
jgi:hypothetical protein